MERIDRVVEEYEAVLAAVRVRMDADALNRDMGKAIQALRYDPRDVKPSEWRQEDLDAAASDIMQRFTSKQSSKKPPPVS